MLEINVKLNQEKFKGGTHMKPESKKIAPFKIILIIGIIVIIAIAIVLGMKRKSGGEPSSKEPKTGVTSNEPEVKTLEGNIYYPKDAKVESTKKEEGIVIKDSNQNEWVWVEVPRDASKVYQTSGLGITEFNNENCQKIRFDLKTYVQDIKRSEQSNLGDDYWIQMADDGAYSKYDPLVSESYDRNLDWFKRTKAAGISYWEYSELYTQMLKSIYQNGGFYIGRYETGYNAEKNSINSQDVNQSPVIKQNAAPYSNTTISDAIKLSQKLSTNGLTSSVIFNIQWDLALKFMSTSKKGVGKNKISKDSTTWGNYKNNESKSITADGALKLVSNKEDKSSKWEEIASGTTIKEANLLTTGSSEAFKAMNIYDMAGNSAEFTLGFTSDDAPFSIRGGGFNKEGKKCSAAFVGGDKNTGKYSFRCTLFK